MDNDVVVAPLPGSLAIFEDENGIKDPHSNVGALCPPPPLLVVILHAGVTPPLPPPPSFQSRAEGFISLFIWYCNLYKIKIFDTIETRGSTSQRYQLWLFSPQARWRSVIYIEYILYNYNSMIIHTVSAKIKSLREAA